MFSVCSINGIAAKELEILDDYINELDQLHLDEEKDLHVLKNLYEKFQSFNTYSPIDVLPRMEMVRLKFEMLLKNYERKHTELYEKVFPPTGKLSDSGKPRKGFFQRILNGFFE